MRKHRLARQAIVANGDYTEGTAMPPHSDS